MSWKAFCTGCRVPSGAWMPSMVVTSAPSACTARTVQDLTACPQRGPVHGAGEAACAAGAADPRGGGARGAAARPGGAGPGFPALPGGVEGPRAAVAGVAADDG